MTANITESGATLHIANYNIGFAQIDKPTMIVIRNFDELDVKKSQKKLLVVCSNSDFYSVQQQ